jgi:hypothetical protein
LLETLSHLFALLGPTIVIAGLTVVTTSSSAAHACCCSPLCVALILLQKKFGRTPTYMHGTTQERRCLNSLGMAVPSSIEHRSGPHTQIRTLEPAGSLAGDGEDDSYDQEKNRGENEG